MNDEPTDLLLIGDSMISKLKTGFAQNLITLYFYPWNSYENMILSEYKIIFHIKYGNSAIQEAELKK